MAGKRAAARVPSGARADKRSRSNPSDDIDAADTPPMVRAISAPPPPSRPFVLVTSAGCVRPVLNLALIPPPLPSAAPRFLG